MDNILNYTKVRICFVVVLTCAVETIKCTVPNITIWYLCNNYQRIFCILIAALHIFFKHNIIYVLSIKYMHRVGNYSKCHFCLIVICRVNRIWMDPIYVQTIYTLVLHITCEIISWFTRCVPLIIAANYSDIRIRIFGCIFFTWVLNYFILLL